MYKKRRRKKRYKKKYPFCFSRHYYLLLYTVFNFGIRLKMKCIKGCLVKCIVLSIIKKATLNKTVYDEMQKPSTIYTATYHSRNDDHVVDVQIIMCLFKCGRKKI